MEVKVELGRIYTKYNEETKKFDKYRVKKIEKNEDGSNTIIIHKLNDNFKFAPEIEEHDELLRLDEKGYLDFKKEHVLLKPDAVLSVSDILAAVLNNGTPVKDVLLMMFKVKSSGEPDMLNPDMIARAAATDVIAQLAGDLDRVGLSVTKDSIPKEYEMSDFLECNEILRSRLYYLYKVDSPSSIKSLIADEDTDKIFKDLFDNRIYYLQNTKIGFNKDEVKDTIDGYCNSMNSFLSNSLAMLDIQSLLGVMHIPGIKLKEKEALSDEDMLAISVFYGGVRIAKSGAIKFDYDIDIDNIKVKYFLIMDDDEQLWIVPYTEDEKEYLKYSLSDEAADSILSKMRSVAKVGKTPC